MICFGTLKYIVTKICKTNSVIVCSILSQSCYKNTNGLPEATNTGRNIFGMMLNGKAWIPNNTHVAGPITHAPTVQYYPQTNELWIEAYKESIGTGTIRIGATINGIGDHYFLHRFYSYSNINCLDSVEYDPSNICIGQYNVFDSSNCKLTITTFDTIKHIVSGIFKAELYNIDSDKITVEDGRFDAHYTNQK